MRTTVLTQGLTLGYSFCGLYPCLHIIHVAAGDGLDPSPALATDFYGSSVQVCEASSSTEELEGNDSFGDAGRILCIVGVVVIRCRYLVLKKTKIHSVVPHICINQDYRKGVGY